MLSLVAACRGAPLRAASARWLPPSRAGLQGSRPLITAVRGSRFGDSGLKLSRINELVKSNGIFVRLCSATPKPQHQSKIVGYWLLGCSGMVFAAVVLGGVTRLTESGLSMVTWRLLGERLPASEPEWRAEFERYQQYPEYKYKNSHITLSEFKWIWYMEFAHRSWGRALGAAVLLPAAALWARGRLDGGMKRRVAACCALVGAQGLMGWYMVKSGLEDRFQGPSDVPRVSQYRLAAHLSLAFILYVGLLGGALRVLRPAAGLQVLNQGKELRRLTAMAHAVKGLAFVTAVSGAFVAGLDAGLVYNSFPKMGDRWLPDDILALEPAARNFTENPATVQLDHRILGTLTLAASSALWAAARGRRLTRPARLAVTCVAAVAWCQVALGITTLLHYVPTPLAAAHQAGSLTLLTAAVWAARELRLLRYLPK